MDKQHIKALAEKHGVKKPMMKGDYSEAFYAFVGEIAEDNGNQAKIIETLNAELEKLVAVKLLRDEAEKLRLKGKGDGKITTAQLSEVLDAK